MICRSKRGKRRARSRPFRRALRDVFNVWAKSALYARWEC